jgi:hypothetical protein
MAMVTWPNGLGIKAEVSGLGPALRLNGNYGSATVHRQHGLLGLAWTFLRRERVESFVVASAGVAHLSGEGATTDPARAVARSGAAWSALGAAGIAARVRLVKMLWLGAELDGIANVPPLYIRVAGWATSRFLVAWGARRLPLRGLRDRQPTPPVPRFARPRRRGRTIVRGRAKRAGRWWRVGAEGHGEAERSERGGGGRGEPKGRANPFGVPISEGCCCWRPWRPARHAP